MKGIILLLLLSCFSWNISNADNCDCGRVLNQQNAKIFKGQQAKADRYPWQILLEIIPSNKEIKFSRCGGSLISRRHILTAAHCFFDTQTKQ